VPETAHRALKRHDESRANGGRMDLEAPAMRFGDFLADRQPESRAIMMLAWCPPKPIVSVVRTIETV
jgi:hypothetical protein